MILDGKAIAREVRHEVAEQVVHFRERVGRAPGLAVILLGGDPASKVYVGSKERACEQAGLRSFPHHLPGSTTEAELLALIDRLNADPDVDGILVQLPLPAGIQKNRVLMAVDPCKDVDGFHPVNVGLLALRRPRFAPCTPQGVMELLARTGTTLRGRSALVVGRGRTVGLPMALMLNGADCTITAAHRFTVDLRDLVSRAEILVVAVGKPGLIPGEWIRPGAVVIDVGITRVDGRIVGDVDFEGAKERASAISPVPGGVGPMTVAMLLRNTLKAARLREGLERYTGEKIGSGTG